MIPYMWMGLEAAFGAGHEFMDQGRRMGGMAWDLWRYTVDFTQRSVLMADVLRRRGNQYFEYNETGLPPITPFPLEPILDGRWLDRPVNRVLVRVADRRRREEDEQYKDRRTSGSGRRMDWEDQTKRPIIFQDPDAGRGLISASRNTSEIGLAIDTGHPTFLILIHPETVKGQTMDDLVESTRIFTEKVREICPHEKPPAYICNCQAGWQIALSAAGSPGLDGPIVPVGAPISYWSRGTEPHSLRYSGGLVGGTWLTLLMGDLGDGVIDGLPPLNFELFDIDRHPILDSLKWLQQADDERKIAVFLTQQKWVYGFHELGAEQFYWIIRELFVGNKLERGLVRLNGAPVDLRNIEDAIIFTSYGDTITPVPQGIGWIPRVWSSTEEIKKAGVKLVLIHHQKAGHLAIFVSAKVADREHRVIIDALADEFDRLPPGLFRMDISQEGDHPPTYATTFREIDLEEIRALLDDSERPLFHRVGVVSEVFDRLYRITARPAIRTLSNPMTAELFRRIHPMRLRASVWADRRNPGADAVRTLSGTIREHRLPSNPDNIFFRWEGLNRELLAVGLNLFREIRDASYEHLFHLLYGDANPVMKAMLPGELFSDDAVDHETVAKNRFPWLYLGSEAPPESLHEAWMDSLPKLPACRPLVGPEALWKCWTGPRMAAEGWGPALSPVFSLAEPPSIDWGAFRIREGDRPWAGISLFHQAAKGFWERWAPWLQGSRIPGEVKAIA